MSAYFMLRRLLVVVASGSAAAGCGGQVGDSTGTTANRGDGGTAGSGGSSGSGGTSGGAGGSSGSGGSSAGAGGSSGKAGGGGSAGKAGSGGSAAGTGGGSGAGGAGGTPGNACAQGEGCSPDEWCGGTGISTYCACSAAGAFECMQQYPWGKTVSVCLAQSPGIPCPTNADPNLYQAVQNRFNASCSGPTVGPKEAHASNGAAQCCYQLNAQGCVGRPLVVDAGLRVARLVHSSGWALG